MPSDLEFTGERFVPGIAGEIAYEHWHRYAMARRYVAGKRVVDVACGEGYGSALLAAVARTVTGIDIDGAAVAHASACYAALPNLRFAEGSATTLPIPDASVDVVVSFETIEHLPRADQPRMLAEIARVLVRDGVLVLSAPNPVEYSTARNYRNPFHPHEPDRAELEALLAAAFPARRWFRQRRYMGSVVWSETATEGVEALTGDAANVGVATPPAAMYFVVVAARAPASLPSGEVALSLFTDRAEGELVRIDALSGEVLRQDRMLRESETTIGRQAAHVLHLEQIAAAREGIVVERDAELARRATHIAHLEEIASYRERIVVERDGQLAESNELREALGEERDGLARALGSARQAVAAQGAECERLERAIAAQERIIAYRQSARWWFALPWLRVRLWWQRLRSP